MEKKIRIALDLDDTILYQKPNTSYFDNEMEAFAGVRLAIAAYRRDGFEVVVYTSRKACEYEAVESTLRQHGIEVDAIFYDKLQFDVLVDNKAMTFTGSWLNTDFCADVTSAAMINRDIDRVRYPEFFK